MGGLFRVLVIQFGFNYTPNHDFDGVELATVLDSQSSTPQEKYTTMMKIYKMNQPGSLNSVVNMTYLRLDSGIISLSKNKISFNGQSGYEAVYQEYKEKICMRYGYLAEKGRRYLCFINLDTA